MHWGRKGQVRRSWWPVAIGCDLIVKANNDFGVAPSIWQDVNGFLSRRTIGLRHGAEQGRSNWQDSS
jgi:hypothetical protein